eukprot:2569629-Prymnesium_polylepis.1
MMYSLACRAAPLTAGTASSTHPAKSSYTRPERHLVPPDVWSCGSVPSSHFSGCHGRSMTA